MKAKLLNFLSISLATLGLFAPIPRVLAASTEYHSNLVESQNWVSDFSSKNSADSKQCIQPQSTQSLLPENNAAANIPPNQEKNLGQAIAINHSLIAFVIGLTVFGYVLNRVRAKKHRNIQAASLQEQIEMLERIWNKSPQR